MVSMRAYIIAGIVAFAGNVAGGEGSSLLPPDRSVQVNLRQFPKDPTSAVTHKMSLVLTAFEVQGNQVAWEAKELVVRRMGAFGEIDATWSTDWPAINTLDGLWWVDHADPMSPSTDEFTNLPLMIGTATSLDPFLDRMEYAFEGRPEVVPPGGTLFPVSGGLAYTLAAETND